MSNKLIDALTSGLTGINLEGTHKERRRGGGIGENDSQKVVKIMHEDLEGQIFVGRPFDRQCLP